MTSRCSESNARYASIQMRSHHERFNFVEHKTGGLASMTQGSTPKTAAIRQRCPPYPRYRARSRSEIDTLSEAGLLREYFLPDPTSSRSVESTKCLSASDLINSDFIWRIFQTSPLADAFHKPGTA